MFELKTDPNLINAIERSAGQSMTPTQVREQRVSFVMSGLREGSKVSRDEVNLIIDQREGTAT